MKTVRIIAPLILLVGLIFTWSYFYADKPPLLKERAMSGISASSTSSSAFVTKIIDGDTFVIEGGAEVRMLGIDADEYGHPCYAAAKDQLEYLLLDQRVTLESEGKDRDQYGRLLRYVLFDGKNVNVQLVQWGLVVARFIGEQTKYKTEIVAAEKEAIANHIGCKWAQT